jgi:hypothetical protein
MSNAQEFKKNTSGYSDPTAYEAVKNIDSDMARFQKLLTAIFSICELAGFHIEERIVIRDLKTGKVYR